MPTPSKDHRRAERLRAHAAAVERARDVVAAMAPLVCAREARDARGETLLEVEFAQVEIDGRALPAAVWVALRRADVDAAVDAMTAASQTRFLLEEREVMGAGYRLESVQDTLPLPESELLTAQLSRALDVPIDVLSVIAEWGPDDPRAASEIDDLLTSRFGPPGPGGPDSEVGVAPWRRSEDQTATGQLVLTVSDAAQVLRLDDDQVRALTILVRSANVTLTNES
jgi:hypothetical protein